MLRPIAILLVACGSRNEVAAPPVERSVASANDAAVADAPVPETVRHQIERRVDEGPKHRLSKAELRPRMKVVMRLLDRCYADARAIDPRISGVVNTELTIRSDPSLGISLTVTGYDTVGPLGESKAFLGCVKSTLEADVLPALPTEGRLDVIYPLTFDPGGVDHRDTFVPLAVREEKQGRWTEALAAAERGLEQPWLPGAQRHTLIEIAGTCACRVKDEPKARHFFALASPEFEDNLVRACTAAGISLLD